MADQDRPRPDDPTGPVEGRTRPDRPASGGGTDPHRPDHPGNFPTAGSGRGRNTTTRWVGIAVGGLLLVTFIWWLSGGTTQTPGQEHTLGEPAGVGTTAVPEGQATDSGADPDDPQAAIGADPFTEPTSPAAAEQAGTEPDGAEAADAETDAAPPTAQ